MLHFGASVAGGIGGNRLQFPGVSLIQSLGPAAWYRYGIGLTDAGAGACSAWADQSGNARNLTAAGSARPTIQADQSLLFDGVANSMTTGAFTFNQPATIYVLGRQVTWTSNDFWFDGIGGARMGVSQSATTPNIRCFAGASTFENNGLSLNSYGVITALFNGASSGCFVNGAGPALSDAGAGNAGGIILGSSNTFGFGNIQVKEVILFPAAHDAATRAIVITYLAAVGGLNI